MLCFVDLFGVKANSFRQNFVLFYCKSQLVKGLIGIVFASDKIQRQSCRSSSIQKKGGGRGETLFYLFIYSFFFYLFFFIFEF